jgi:hypothetical protein
LIFQRRIVQGITAGAVKGWDFSYQLSVISYQLGLWQR